MVTWAATFAQNHLNHISASNGIYICYIRQKNRLHAFTVMRRARPRRYSMRICWAMAVANRFRAAFVAKISQGNTIWIGIYCTPVVTNHDESMKPHATCVANSFLEPTIFVNIFARTLANRRGNAIISARIAPNHFMVHRYSSKCKTFELKMPNSICERS